MEESSVKCKLRNKHTQRPQSTWGETGPNGLFIESAKVHFHGRFARFLGQKENLI